MKLPVTTLVRRGVVLTSAAQRPCPSLFVYPGLTSRAFWAPAQLPPALAASLSAICSAREEVLAEFDALAAAAPAGDYALRENEHALNDGEWTWHTAVAKGTPRADFAVAAPKTMGLLAAVPGLLLGGVPFAYAFFSAMRAGVHIAPHFGPTNTRLRVHVPLRLPRAPGAAITVAGETRAWVAGEPLVFDDAYEHSAVNATAEPRVVLLFDVWHPELSRDERTALEHMFDGARKEGWLK
jgi:aspartate beta-hydroxylase